MINFPTIEYKTIIISYVHGNFLFRYTKLKKARKMLKGFLIKRFFFLCLFYAQQIFQYFLNENNYKKYLN